MKAKYLVATTAIVLGTGQMLMGMKDVYLNDDLTGYNFPSVFVGLVSTSLWMVYQVSNGVSFTVVPTSVGLVAQMYVLQRLIARARTEAQSRTLRFSSIERRPALRMT